MKPSPFMMVLLLIFFSFVLAAVLSCYREDEKAEILRGTLRRAIVFFVSVGGFAALAFLLSDTLLLPSS
jgi:membrane-anchored glycerophosphoryl diester phosphodiesterase (GDPDase)